MPFCLQFYLFHALAGCLFHFKKVGHQVLFFAFSAAGCGFNQIVLFFIIIVAKSQQGSS
jgi:hypothetical protein